MKSQYIIPVAGTEYEQSAISSLMLEKNYKYLYSKKELLDDLADDLEHVDEKLIYEYAVTECEFKIRHEADNPDNPAALQVFADGKMIGYVPEGNLENLMKLSQIPDIEMCVQLYGGPYKYLEWDEEADTMNEKTPEYFKLFRRKDTFKANMAFRWQDSESESDSEADH